MSTFTNKLQLPDAICKAVTSHRYDNQGSDISVTALLTPPRKRVLTLRNKDSIIEDVADRLFALYGSMAHLILEMNAEGFSEERLFVEVLGWKVSGQVDLIEKESIIDFKLTSAWSVLEGVKLEWHQQINLYAWLSHKNNISVKSASIVAMLRDWSPNDARKSQDYPQTPIVKFDIPLWPLEKTEAFITERVKMHQDAEKELPICSSEDCWERPTTYALMKKGNQRASKVCDSLEEAQQNKKPEHEIVVRPGERVRCLSYCSCSSICSQYQEYKKQNEPST